MYINITVTSVKTIAEVIYSNTQSQISNVCCVFSINRDAVNHILRVHRSKWQDVLPAKYEKRPRQTLNA